MDPRTGMGSKAARLNFTKNPYIFIISSYIVACV